MTKEEWYTSPMFLKLRLINNITGEIKHKTQELNDLLALLEAERGPLMVHDRFCLAERQLHIVDMEAKRLQEYMGRLDDLLSPRTFDEPKPEGDQS